MLGQAGKGQQVGGWIVLQHEMFAGAAGQSGGFGQRHGHAHAALMGGGVHGDDQFAAARIAGVQDQRLGRLRLGGSLALPVAALKRSVQSLDGPVRQMDREDASHDGCSAARDAKIRSIPT